jgi:hypothetical protein
VRARFRCRPHRHRSAYATFASHNARLSITIVASEADTDEVTAQCLPPLLSLRSAAPVIVLER